MRFLASSIAILAALFSTAIPAHAQLEASAEDLVRDNMNMQKCVETVRDQNEGGGNEAKMEDCIGIISTSCMKQPNGETTIGMSICLQRETNWWDGWLNGHYRQLKDIMNKDDFAQLRDMQRKWIAFKDAKCRFEHSSWKGGTIASVTAANCYMTTTADQAIILAGHLNKGW